MKRVVWLEVLVLGCLAASCRAAEEPEEVVTSVPPPYDGGLDAQSSQSASGTATDVAATAPDGGSTVGTTAETTGVTAVDAGTSAQESTATVPSTGDTSVDAAVEDTVGASELETETSGALDSGASSAGTPGSDAAVNDAAASDAGKPPTDFVGSVFVLATDGGDAQWVYPDFHEETSVARAFDTQGNCRLMTLEQTPEAVRYLSAGVISFVGSDSSQPDAGNVVTLVPESDGSYFGAPYHPSEMLGAGTARVTAEGAEVPAFDVTLELAPSIVLSSPAAIIAGADATVSVPRSDGLELEWEPGAAGVQLLVTGPGATADGRGQNLTCEFPAMDGTGTLSAELLGKFGGDKLDFYTYVTTTITAGQRTVRVSVASDVLTPDKSARIGGVIQ
jgi:hypothetical protein